MTTLDIFLLIPFLYAAFKGITKGFLVQAGTLVALIVGMFVAYKFSEWLGAWMQTHWKIAAKVAYYASFALLFLGVLVGMYFLTRAIEQMIKTMALNWLNRLAGFLFAMLKMAIIVSTLIYIFEAINIKMKLVDKKVTNESIVYRYVQPVAPKTFDFFGQHKEQVKEFVNEHSKTK